ncbi:MAG TPA: hypothetical protein DDY93_07425, partial [Dehalococcoidia bacterium]|nr:hypothetical protein [Dehalococcoidia bacterium]
RRRLYRLTQLNIAFSSSSDGPNRFQVHSVKCLFGLVQQTFDSSLDTFAVHGGGILILRI